MNRVAVVSLSNATTSSSRKLLGVSASRQWNKKVVRNGIVGSKPLAISSGSSSRSTATNNNGKLLLCRQWQLLFSTTAASSSSSNVNADGVTNKNAPQPDQQQQQDAKNTSTTSRNTTTNLTAIRKSILKAALTQVHEHGWTEDALAAATMSVLNETTPSGGGGATTTTTTTTTSMSVMGMITVDDLIGYCMDEWNIQLKVDLMNQRHQRSNTVTDTNADTETTTGTSTSSYDNDPLLLLEQGIKTRLEYLIPYLKSHRWHEGMALGIRGPSNALRTQRQLQDMIDIIVASPSTNRFSLLGVPEKMALGAVYVATELHMLTDSSPGYQDTWDFLASRMQDWHRLVSSLASSTSSSSSSTTSAAVAGDALFVASSVASSLASGLVSLVMNPTTNTTTAGSVVSSPPFFMSGLMMPDAVWKALFRNNPPQQQQGTSSTSSSSSSSWKNGSTGGGGHTNDGTHPRHYDVPKRS